ncbi:MAG: amidohydrolase family protein [Firmicutes bacterium]|nr:amidohydrolase family protein [Bacillota bacterium]
MRANIPIIDAHMHVSPASVEQVVRIMDSNNIEAMVDMTPSLSIPLLEKDFPGPFTLGEKLEAFSKFPGRFIPFCGINFEGFGTEGWLEREKNTLARHVEAGAIGVKLWKTLGLQVVDNEGKVVTVDDERLAPLLEYAQELGCILCFHVADPQAFFEALTPDNPRWDTLQTHPHWWFGDRERYPYGWWQIIKQLERVIARHRKGTIVGAHFGCAVEEIDYTADLMRQHPHYVIDIAARLADIGEHDPSYITDIFTEFQDRILFATDLAFKYPIPAERARHAQSTWHKYRAYFETTGEEMASPSRPPNGKMNGVGLSSDILEKLYHRNARQYFVDR